MNAYDNFNQLRLSETVSPHSLVDPPQNHKNPSYSDAIAGMGFLFFLALIVALIKWCDIRKASSSLFLTSALIVILVQNAATLTIIPILSVRYSQKK